MLRHDIDNLVRSLREFGEMLLEAISKLFNKIGDTNNSDGQKTQKDID